MATRSRLGRDPLQSAAKPPAKKNRPAGKGKTTVKASERVGPVAPADALPATEPGLPDAATPLSQDVHSAAPAATDTPPPPAAPEATPAPRIVQAAPGEPCQTPVTAPAAPQTPPAAVDAPTEDTGPNAPAEPEPATPLLQADAITAQHVESCPGHGAGIPAASGLADAPIAGNDARPLASMASEAAAPFTPHPVEGFLQGVLESLLPEGFVAVTIRVDPETLGMPAEKLFFFSHALQLLVSAAEQTTKWPTQWPGHIFRPSRGAHDEPPRLTLDLQARSNGSHVLRLYDNGLFFSEYLDNATLEADALRPLLLYVVGRQGSLCLRQGRCTEFSVTK